MRAHALAHAFRHPEILQNGRPLWVHSSPLARYMRPEGPWQRLASALADSSAFLTPFKDQILSPTTMGHTGATLSPPHDPPDKKRRYQIDKGKKQRKSTA